jgi:hypothetical protein
MIAQISLNYQRKTGFVLLFLLFTEFIFGGLARAAMLPYNPCLVPSYYNRHLPAIVKQNFIATAFPDKEDLPGGNAGKDSLKKEIALQAEAMRRVDSVYIGGPSQPEMSAFTSVNTNNMVNLFSGDFTYNVPLMDVGGYPVNIAYSSGTGMDDEASWVGLGWNINPGTISRNLRGLPDDFNGGEDKITKTMSIKENRTVGVTAGANLEVVGMFGIGASAGVFHNTYNGWGYETGLNPSINVGFKSFGELSGGLSIGNNSQNGITLSPSLAVKVNMSENADKQTGSSGSFSIGSAYNSRTGLKGLQLNTGVSLYKKYDAAHQNAANDLKHTASGSIPSYISFANPSYTPGITMPYTSSNVTFSGKVGGEIWGIHGNLSVRGYVSRQGVAEEDKKVSRAAYGYLNFQNATSDNSALLDFNREKEIPYHEKPAVPNIGIPSYTYDAFSITGEGTGGMFRAYRGDIGYIRDHYNATKDKSASASIDLGLGNLVHGGADIGYTRSITQTGAWLENNPSEGKLNFRQNSGLFEAAYFRNPGEKVINDKSFYENIGGDDVVTIGLNQFNSSSSAISTTNYYNRYRNKTYVGRQLLTAGNTYKQQRDKRSQVISYLTAEEASSNGLDTRIIIHDVNTFTLSNCTSFNISAAPGTGLKAEYYLNTSLSGEPEVSTVDPYIFSSANPPNTPLIETGTNLPWPVAGPYGNPRISQDKSYSIRWSGYIKSPVTGSVKFWVRSDDGVRFYLNNQLLLNHWDEHALADDYVTVNMVKDQLLPFKLEYFQHLGDAGMHLLWEYQGQSNTTVPTTHLYPELPETIQNATSGVNYERRINDYRRPNHISEIDVLNSDGRRYVYGIPAYNFKQKESTFSVDKSQGNAQSGLADYTATDNSTDNDKGKEGYFSSEEVPSYAHSFLLTGILSSDYQDLTGNGISDDDPGDAVKFNYSRVSGKPNPFTWRAPYNNQATYNEGLKTYSRDDKASIVYGEKELWYLHSIESKNMYATFVVQDRNDLLPITADGEKSAATSGKCLKEINLYSKPDVLRNGIANATPIKTVHFEYEYQLCPGVYSPVTANGKLTLKKIWFSYNGNSKGAMNPYVFTYNTLNPSYTAKAYDRWGSYKDPLQNPGSSAGDVITNAEYPYALQDSTVAAQNAAAWALDQIKLPSGGIMKVTYEADDYAYVQNKRAMNMYGIAGFSSSPSSPQNKLYQQVNTFSIKDNLYVFIDVPDAVSSNADVLNKYLEGIEKLYFKLSVKMPADQWGSGNEYVPGYADLDIAAGPGVGYGYVSPKRIWVKMKGISSSGDAGGDKSPMAKAAIQFLRLNLPSKAYPGSEPGDGGPNVVGMIVSLATSVSQIIRAFNSFDDGARNKGWVQEVELKRSWTRLNNPYYKKYGGGHRVKRVVIYDNWTAMTGGKEATYGQEYTYTTVKQVNGVSKTISSGVAVYEPMLGGEENPFHQPLEYAEKASVLAPVTLGYTEMPLGEGFFPSPGVGYSKVRVRSIHTKNKKSATGYEESTFFTAYDFPTIVDWSPLDDQNKKRYKSPLGSILRINSRHFLAISQGFKIELNDMHGKQRSTATYAETDFTNPLTYTENFYRVDNLAAEAKHLNNEVMVMKPDGTVDGAAIIGKDVEVMNDFREQRSVTNGYNLNLNSEFFYVPPWFFILLLPLFNLTQREETLFRSAATVKVINRYGILDSVVNINKGSRVSTKNMLYDSETGDVLLSRTQNEFNDPLYNFNYPAHWAYDNLGGAYKNIGLRLPGLTLVKGAITNGLPAGTTVNTFFASGDELMVASKPRTDGQTFCTENQDSYATFPVTGKRVWAVDVNATTNGLSPAIHFVDEEGNGISGNDVELKVIRSGRKNLFGTMVGSVTSLVNPLKQTGNTTYLSLDNNSKVINTSAAEYKQFWKVAERKKSVSNEVCASIENGCNCDFLKKLFDYMNFSKKFYIKQSENKTVRDIISDASQAGFLIDTLSCPIAKSNLNEAFYALSTPFGNDFTTNFFVIGDSAQNYRLHFGNCIIQMRSPNYSMEWNYDYMIPYPCSGNKVIYGHPDNGLPVDTAGIVEILECTNCEIITSFACYNPITDTSVNPYLYGLLGNWRGNKSYVYYGRRAEQLPSGATNLRRDGAFADFHPFWAFNNGKLQPQYDTTRWVWNSEMTLFNGRGFEVENKDPLGRYNAGQYGYNQTLPVAVTQNSRYDEAAFEGFEDYSYGSNACDQACPTSRHFDFSSYKAQIDSTQKHSGKYSLRVATGGSLSFAATVKEQPATATLDMQTATYNCGKGLKGIYASHVLLPNFSPYQGKKMVFSLWLKEARDCSCTTYTNNTVSVYTANGTQQVGIEPSGVLIEGWQRYEGVFDIGASDTVVSFTVQSAGNNPVLYVDDIRIHPFNANMKSFVYNPVNLRLMAELDENNYASFYEYDDDGTLIRVKKETARGIKTIKETRSGLVKDLP